jgi:hypothetical protein
MAWGGSPGIAVAGILDPLLGLPPPPPPVAAVLAPSDGCAVAISAEELEDEDEIVCSSKQFKVCAK